MNLQAQEQQPELATANKWSDLASRFSVSATIGTPTIGTSEFSSLNLKRLSQINISNINISYKLNPRMSFGLSSMNNLSNGVGGYFDAEDKFVSFCEDDDDDMDDDDHMDDDMDDMDDDDMDDHDMDDDCDEDDFGENIMGTMTYILSDKVPFFVQAAGGYSLSSKAPVYSTMIGYNQKIVAGLGINAGIRYSNVLHRTPANATNPISAAGFKLEIGANWNF